MLQVNDFNYVLEQTSNWNLCLEAGNLKTTPSLKFRIYIALKNPTGFQ